MGFTTNELIGQMNRAKKKLKLFHGVIFTRECEGLDVIEEKVAAYDLMRILKVIVKDEELTDNYETQLVELMQVIDKLIVQLPRKRKETENE